MTTQQQRQANLDAAVKAVIAYYDYPVAVPGYDTYPAANVDRRQERDWQWTDAVAAVCSVLKDGGTVRQIAQRAHLPGRLVIAFVEDPQTRADAFAAEIHHLERSLRDVQEMRARDARGRYTGAHGEKAALADSYGVTRPTLDKWLHEPDE